MKILNLYEILKSIKGTVVNGKKNKLINHVTTKPEEIQRNTLYFHFSNSNDWRALPNDVVVVTDKPSLMVRLTGRNTTIVKVRDVERAYWSFIYYYRNLFSIPVIGVTGTSGKTTTTEMIKHILSYQHKVQSTYDGKNNLNNNLYYLMGIDERTDAAVFELGVSHPGCIRHSCRYFRPNVGVLLNIGVYHLLGCKTFDNYLRAKAEILEGVTPGGTLVINADDENIRKIDLRKFKGNIVFFSLRNAAHYRASDIEYIKGGMKYVLNHENVKYQFFIPGYGKQNVANALAAIAAAHAVGISIQDAGERLASFKPVRQHLDFRPGIKGATIIDDTWNNTPPSLEAALEVLYDTAKGKKKIAVIGYMPQLGKNALSEYDRIGTIAVKANLDQLILIGEAKRIGIRAARLGMDRRRIHFCNTGKEVYYTLLPYLDANTMVLFKFPYKYRLHKYPSFQRLMQVMFKN